VAAAARELRAGRACTGAREGLPWSLAKAALANRARRRRSRAEVMVATASSEVGTGHGSGSRKSAWAAKVPEVTEHGMRGLQVNRLSPQKESLRSGVFRSKFRAALPDSTKRHKRA
jgi:hypothetical protein